MVYKSLNGLAPALVSHLIFIRIFTLVSIFMFIFNLVFVVIFVFTCFFILIFIFMYMFIWSWSLSHHLYLHLYVHVYLIMISLSSSLFTSLSSFLSSYLIYLHLCFFILSAFINVTSQWEIMAPQNSTDPISLKVCLVILHLCLHIYVHISLHFCNYRHSKYIIISTFFAARELGVFCGSNLAGQSRIYNYPSIRIQFASNSAVSSTGFAIAMSAYGEFETSVNTELSDNTRLSADTLYHWLKYGVRNKHVLMTTLLLLKYLNLVVR